MFEGIISKRPVRQSSILGIAGVGRSELMPPGEPGEVC